MLDKLRDRLVYPGPAVVSPYHDDSVRQAAVLMALTDTAAPEMVFIRRARHVNSHSGQVALPGGMWEADDGTLLETALRESEEEIGLPAERVEIIGALEPQVTRFDVRVLPFVGVIPDGLSFVPELAELDAIFQVPLHYLLDGDNYSRSRFDTPVGSYEAPCIFYREYCIWGVTYAMLTEMLGEVFNFTPAVDQEPLEL